MARSGYEILNVQRGEIPFFIVWSFTNTGLELTDVDTSPVVSVF